MKQIARTRKSFSLKFLQI